MEKSIAKITLTKRKSRFRVKSLNQTTSSLCNPEKRREKRTNIKTSPNIKGQNNVDPKKKIRRGNPKIPDTKVKNADTPKK